MRILGHAALAAILLAVVAFLMLPIVIIVLVSFSNSAIFDLPSGIGALSVRWYLSMWRLDSFWQAFLSSFFIAATATFISLVLGIASAIALVQGRFRGRRVIMTFLVAPLMLPGLVLGIALLQGLRGIGVRDAMTSLMIAHVVITLPFIIRSVSASLALFEFNLIDAAQTLGCSYVQAIRKVLVPNIAPGIITGCTFAFITSFDNYSVSLFLTDVRTTTLPIQVLTYLEQSPDPSVAAISTLMILMTIAALVTGQRLVGLDRLAKF